MGKNQLPEDLYRQTAYDITCQRIEAELILIGRVGGRFCLFTCIAGEVTACPHFAAIGSGAPIASSVLFQREHVFYRAVPLALYVVYEAKRLAEIAPGVGKLTSYAILGPPTKLKARLLYPKDGLAAWGNGI